MAELLALAGTSAEDSPQDPRRIHLRSCPRCRGLLAAYAAFAASGADDFAPGEDAAARRLQDYLEKQILGAREDSVPLPRGNEGPAPDARASGRSDLRFPPVRAWWSRFLLPACGALAIAAAAILLIRGERPEPFHAPALRGEPGASAPGTVVALPARVLAGGGVALSWRRLPEAETYRVRILDIGLQEIAEQNAGADSIVVLDSPFLHLHAGAVFWQVEALCRGDRIGDSTPARLPAH